MSDSDDFDFTKPAAPSTASVPTAPPPAAPPPPPIAPFKPAISKYYDPNVARALFDAAGMEEKIAAGTTIFAEGEKSGKQGLFGKRVIHRVYFVTQGEINLVRGEKALDTIKAGEIFGEMAVIAEIPGAASGGTRSAAAIAKTDCVLRSLDGQQLEASLTKTPEFALMLMSVMFERLRFVAARLSARRTQSTGRSESVPVFDPETVQSLEDRFERATLVRFESGRVIMREGDAGANMYVVVKGRVSVSIKGTEVEINDLGCTFGEMALVDQSPRTATATAKGDCELLAVSRTSLLTMVRKEPSIGMLILRSVAQRLRHMNSLLG